jgi:hypothetical protein
MSKEDSIMKSSSFKYFVFILCVLLIGIFNSCSLLRPKFDPDGLKNAETLKAEAELLMDRAVDFYSNYREEVEQLMKEVEVAYEYSLTRKFNDRVIAKWNLLRDPTRDRLAGFMEVWKTEDKLDKEMIAEAKKWVTLEFDTLIELENAKKK